MQMPLHIIAQPGGIRKGFVRRAQNVAIAKFYGFAALRRDRMRVLILKKQRKLYLMDGDAVLLCAPVGLGRHPLGRKERAGDGKTPEGVYSVCLVKPNGKYGRSLGISYPNSADARLSLEAGWISTETCQAIQSATAENRRPPWGTAQGGEIYIHEGGAQEDWTQGCIALNSADMDTLYPHRDDIAEVEIRP
jgi:murein L,D-transpeptidase YafK